MRKTISGFTVVELLIIITVIGILAAISVVAYNGIQKSSRNATRLAELKGWQKTFQTYKSRNGTYPDVTATDYCLGSDFPVGYNGEKRCRNYTLSNASISYKESDNAAFMTALGSVGLPAVTGGKIPVADLVGPYVDYWGKDWGGYLVGVFEGGNGDCPKGLNQEYVDSDGAVLCGLQI